MKKHDSNKTIVKTVVTEIALFPVHFYRYVISPLTPASCRHIPSCSEYALHAVKRYGLVEGGVMAASRIGRCHPWGTSGFDPVPLYKFRIFNSSSIHCDRLRQPQIN